MRCCKPDQDYHSLLAQQLWTANMVLSPTHPQLNCTVVPSGITTTLPSSTTGSISTLGSTGRARWATRGSTAPSPMPTQGGSSNMAVEEAHPLPPPVTPVAVVATPTGASAHNGTPAAEGVAEAGRQGATAPPWPPPPTLATVRQHPLMAVMVPPPRQGGTAEATAPPRPPGGTHRRPQAGPQGRRAGAHHCLPPCAPLPQVCL